MCHTAMKASCLWTNIGEVAVQNGKFALSVYQCAHFSGSSHMFLRHPGIILTAF